ncbi:MAG: hypothetical protein CSA62_10990 [Planctomycetota bacterium]|nr:MAG: hypothetical protein CSA62_10990 [Planctomycetota bacterium]
MQLRKEQILFVVVLLIVVWLFASDKDGRIGRKLRRPSKKAVPAIELPNSSLAQGAQKELERDARDLFLKPSASKPLPPLELPLPALADLPVQLPLLEPGPVLARAHLLRVKLGDLPRVAAQARGAEAGGSEDSGPGSETSDGAPDEDPDGNGAADGAPQEAPAGPSFEQEPSTVVDHSDEYDLLTLNDGRKVWGQVRGEHPFAYGRPEDSNVWALIGPFKQPVLFQTYRPEKGTAGITNPWPAEKVLRVEFAKRVENKIALMQRRIPDDDSGLSLRKAFVLDLLQNHRDSEDALKEAARQAQRHIELAPHYIDGYELLAFVYHATGQFEKELEFYDSLANGPFKEAAFVHVGRAVVARKLGMHSLAVRELEAAIARDRSYSRAWLELARCALQAGASEKAVEHARRAALTRASGMEARVSIEVDLVLVQALLAGGQFQEAATSLLEFENRVRDPQAALLGEMRKLRAAAQLGLGKIAEARASYEEAATLAPSDAEAALGACVASLRSGDRAAALAHAKDAARRDPLLRGRAYAAEALLLDLAGGHAEALARLAEAREIAPRGPYLLYLLGRSLRLAGEFGEAREVLQLLLQERSDFLESMAERALATMQLAQSEAKNDPAGALAMLEEAERFAARVARDEAERGKDPIFLDLLGTIRYHQLDGEGAKEAFEQSLAWKPGPYAKIMLALIAYRQGYTDRAITELVTLTQEIRDPKDRFRKFAERARDAIIDHRGKRLFVDEFERELGELWQPESRHQAKWMAVNGRVQLRGTSQGEDRLARCRYTVDQARNFLELSTEITLLKGFSARKAVLRISDLRSSNLSSARKSRFLLEVGYDATRAQGAGGAFVHFHQNHGGSKKDLSEIGAGDPGFPAELRIERGKPFTVVVRRLGAQRQSGPGARQKETLVVLIDGFEVLRRDVVQAFGLRQNPLAIDFHVQGLEGTRLDTAFDKFRLVRYGEG